MLKNQTHTFTMRGESMTRIETFVAASFAFAITMMVISLGTIPDNMGEFIVATKQIPAFSASCALIIWIWNTHAKWSRRYGLEDGPTIFLSSVLIIQMLVYIYPLRLMMQGLFHTLSGGFFPMSIKYATGAEVRFMFVFYAVGFLLLSLNFMALYLYALKQHSALNLQQIEKFDSKTEVLMWMGAASVSLMSIAISLFSDWLPMSGFIFFALFPIMTGLGFYRGRQRKKLIVIIDTAKQYEQN
jgi:hypothetical protein